MKKKVDLNMQVCHITDYLPNYHSKVGGAEYACWYLLKLLHKQGVVNYVIAAKPIREPNEDFFNFFAIPTSENIIGYKLSFWKRIFYFDFISYFYAKKKFKEIKPNLIHFHNFSRLSPSLILAAKKLKIPIVFSIYDYWFFCPDKILVKKASFWRKLIFNFYLKRIDIFIVLSESSKNILVSFGIPKNKIRTVHLIVPQKHLEEIKNFEKNSILFAGWVNPHKGLHILIQAFPEIIKKFPQTKLYVLGLAEDEYYRKQIQEYIDKNNLNFYIYWKGRLNGKEFNDYFQKSHILVVPEQWHNMSPVILAEAMAVGKLIVASKIGGIPEFIIDNKTGFLVKYDSPRDFAQKIISVFEKTDQELFQIRKLAQQKYIEFFSPEKNAEKIIKLYQSIGL